MTKTMKRREEKLIIVEDTRKGEDVLRGFVCKEEEGEEIDTLILDNGYKIRIFEES